MFLIKNRYYFSFHQHLYSEILSKYIFPYKDIYSTSNWNNQAMVIFFPPPFFFFLSIEFNWKIYLPTIHVLFNAANVCASLDIVPRSLRSTRYSIFSSITNDPSNIDVFSSLLLPSFPPLLIFFQTDRSWFRFFPAMLPLWPSSWQQAEPMSYCKFTFFSREPENSIDENWWCLYTCV